MNVNDYINFYIKNNSKTYGAILENKKDLSSILNQQELEIYNDYKRRDLQRLRRFS